MNKIIKHIEKIYDELASTYDASEELMAIHCDHLIEILNPREGERILNVATGTGFVAFRILGRLKGNVQIIGIDIPSGMLIRAIKKSPVTRSQ